MSFDSLPNEIIEHILSFIPPDDLYDHFFRSSASPPSPSPSLARADEYSNILKMIYSRIFGSKMIVKNKAQKERELSYRPPNISIQPSTFNRDTTDSKVAKRSLSTFEIVDFHDAYSILIQLITFNMNTAIIVFPREINFIFFVANYWDEELELFGKLLEVLAFDNYYFKEDAIPKINVEIRYALASDSIELAARNNKILRRIESLREKMNKITIVNFYSPNQLQLKIRDRELYNFHILLPLKFRNLTDIRLINNGITGSFRQDLKTTAPNLKVLDIRSNNVTSLIDLNLPLSIVEFLCSSNTLTSLNGPNYAELHNMEILNASINAINNIDDLVFPPFLKTLKLDYNSIASISSDVEFPHTLSTLLLLKNYNLNDFTNITLPASIKELYLDENNIKTLPVDFFSLNSSLRVLSLKGNNIDDLDDLGMLPPQLTQLSLDDNEIDYFNWNIILMLNNLEELSMSSIGLISIDHTDNDVSTTAALLPPNLKKLDFSSNQIVSIAPLFRSPFSKIAELKLNENKLESFQLSPHVALYLTFLDLSHNMISSLGDIEFKNFHNLQHLSLSGLKLIEPIDDQFLTQLLPCSNSLIELDLSDISSVVCRDFGCNNGVNRQKSWCARCANAFYELNADFSKFRQLSVLHLNGNKFSRIGTKTKFSDRLDLMAIDSRLINTEYEGKFKQVEEFFMPVGRRRTKSEAKWYKYSNPTSTMEVQT